MVFYVFYCVVFSARAKNADLSSNGRRGYGKVAGHHENSDACVSAGFYHLVDAISWLVYYADHAQNAQIFYLLNVVFEIRRRVTVGCEIRYFFGFLAY